MQTDAISQAEIDELKQPSLIKIDVKRYWRDSEPAALCKLLLNYGRPNVTNVAPDSMLDDIGLNQTQQQSVLHQLQGYFFGSNRTRGNEFASKVAALDNPSVADLSALLRAMAEEEAQR